MNFGGGGQYQCAPQLNDCLIAASAIPGGCYCAPKFFLQFKEFEMYWGDVFLRLEEEYWRSPFLITFIGMHFEAGNETREKFWRDFVAEQNEQWSEKSGFLFISLCSREREIEAWKNYVSERNFLFTRGILKHFFFSFFLVKRFDDFVLILGWFWWWFEVF